jgi:hypothetical protein
MYISEKFIEKSKWELFTVKFHVEVKFENCNLFLNPFCVAVWWYAALFLLSSVYLVIFRKPEARELWYRLIAFYNYQYPPYGYNRDHKSWPRSGSNIIHLLHFTYWNVCRLLTIETVFHCHEIQIEYFFSYWTLLLEAWSAYRRYTAAGMGARLGTLIWKSDYGMNLVTWRRHFNFRHLTALPTVQLFVVLTNNSFQK